MKGRIVKKPAYPCRDLYSKILEAKIGEECLAEWYFHPKRKWRIDYAFPKCRVGIEIDGGIYTQGRHSRGAGQHEDMVKMNAAAEMGWLILHYTPDEKMKTATISQIYRAIMSRRREAHGTESVSSAVGDREGQ